MTAPGFLLPDGGRGKKLLKQRDDRTTRPSCIIPRPWAACLGLRIHVFGVRTRSLSLVIAMPGPKFAVPSLLFFVPAPSLSAKLLIVRVFPKLCIFAPPLQRFTGTWAWGALGCTPWLRHEKWEYAEEFSAAAVTRQRRRLQSGDRPRKAEVRSRSLELRASRGRGTRSPALAPAGRNRNRCFR